MGMLACVSSIANAVWALLLAVWIDHDHHHHHQITKLSHSINAIGPAPHRSGRKRLIMIYVAAAGVLQTA
jgi:hypothetical protein